MSDRPTPETDAFFLTFSDGEAAPSHAEYYDRMVRLERERDEARAHRDELVNTLNDLWRRPRLGGSALWVIKTTIANVEKDK